MPALNQSWGVPEDVKVLQTKMVVVIDEEKATNREDVNDIPKTFEDDFVIKSSPPDGESDFLMNEANIALCYGSELCSNWCVSLSGLACLWGVSIYCLVVSNGMKTTLDEWFSCIVLRSTWFYIVVNPIITCFIIWLLLRSANHTTLGSTATEQKFSERSDLSMLFCAGVGFGLLVYKVAGHLWNENGTYTSELGYRNQTTHYSWEFAVWSPCIMIAIYYVIASYCADLPSLFGDCVWSWIGHAVHGLSAVMTFGGVCTSISLGVIQITAGLRRLEWIDPMKTDMNRFYVAVIWTISAFATVSVINGLKMGIKVLCVLGCCAGCFVIILAYFIQQQNSGGISDTDYFLKSLFFLFDVVKYILLSLYFAN